MTDGDRQMSGDQMEGSQMEGNLIAGSQIEGSGRQIEWSVTDVE